MPFNGKPKRTIFGCSGFRIPVDSWRGHGKGQMVAFPLLPKEVAHSGYRPDHYFLLLARPTTWGIRSRRSRTCYPLLVLLRHVTISSVPRRCVTVPPDPNCARLSGPSPTIIVSRLVACAPFNVPRLLLCEGFPPTSCPQQDRIYRGTLALIFSSRHNSYGLLLL